MKPITMTNRLSMNGALLRAFFLVGLLLTAATVCSAQVTFTEYPVPTPNSVPTEITSGPDGNLWFTERNAGKIGRITTAGVITEFSPPPSARRGGLL